MRSSTNWRPVQQRGGHGVHPGHRLRVGAQVGGEVGEQLVGGVPGRMVGVGGDLLGHPDQLGKHPVGHPAVDELR
jgi:hypothetical protein